MAAVITVVDYVETDEPNQVLPEDSVIRFQLDEFRCIEVQLDGDELQIKSSDNGSLLIAPSATNVVNAVVSHA